MSNTSTMKIQKAGVTAAALIASFVTAGVAFADSHNMPRGMMGMMRNEQQRGVMGQVTAINGSTITIQAGGPERNEDNKNARTYTVQASTATVTKNGAASTLSAITVGDMLMVEGSVSGTNVTATLIRAGIPQGGMGRGDDRGEKKGWGKVATSSHPMMPAMPMGNGQPIAGGTVTSIQGTTMVVTNAANVSYTVDASHANIFKGPATSTLAAIAVGNRVMVQGTVNGSSITAAHIVLQGTPAGGAAQATTTPPRDMHGMMQRLGGVFHKLFGFF